MPGDDRALVHDGWLRSRQPSAHQKHTLSHALANIWTSDSTAPPTKCCPAPQTLIERCGAAPPWHILYML